MLLEKIFGYWKHEIRQGWFFLGNYNIFHVDEWFLYLNDMQNFLFFDGITFTVICQNIDFGSTIWNAYKDNSQAIK